LFLLCAAAVSAQSPVKHEAPPGVDIVKFNWRGVTQRPGWDAPFVSASDQTPEDTRGLPAQEPRVARPPAPTPSRARETRVRPSDATTPALRIPADRSTAYTYEVQVRNTGAGTIEAVEWEYVFLDPSTGGELARHRFHTARRAGPGKSLKLDGSSYAPPTRIVRADAPGRDQKKAFDERIRIRCVVYADGTAAWRANGAEADCDDLRKARTIKNRERRVPIRRS
jgi:hypothetical protein